MKQNCVLPLLLLLLSQSLPAQESPGISFFNGDWAAARQEAKSTGKYLYVDMYTEWCGPCKWMETETYTDPNVAAFMHEHFIPYRADAEKGEGILLSMKYRIRAYPTHLVFNSDGGLLYSTAGGMEPDMFLDVLQKALGPEHATPYKGVSVSLDLDFPDFFKKAITERKRPAEDAVDAYLKEQDDWSAEVPWTVLYFFAWGEPVRGYIEEHQNMLTESYGGDCVDMKLRGFNDRDFAKAIREKDEVLRDTVIARVLRRYTSPDYEKWVKWDYSYRYAMGIKDWEAVIAMVTKRMVSEEEEIAGGMLNSVCWTFYEECDVPEYLAWAVAIMKDVIESEPEWAYVDTYAALLFKTGAYDAAEEQAQRAIEIGKKAGEDVTGTEHLLEKIRAKK